MAKCNPQLGRREFLATSALVAGCFYGFRKASAHGLFSASAASRGYAGLVRDPKGLIDLPEGFTYSILSAWGEEMDDGLLVPGLHDGMAAFPDQFGRTVLVRNHEVGIDAANAYGPFGEDLERLALIDPSLLFDVGTQDKPCLGGTTTVVYDTREQKVVRQFMSLAGTGRNCAGGPTPWGTWLTCEEWVQKAELGCAKDHGWVFEVPATGRRNLAPAKPIKDMGRFYHEAVAIDPRSGCVYLTEDRNDGVLYRFIPNVPGRMSEGGRLQALKIRGQQGMDLRNWIDPALETPAVTPDTPLEVEWLDMDNVESPDDDLRYRAVASGAAILARGEGMWASDDSIFFACTSGGAARIGQIWRYRPSPVEATEAEKTQPGTLELFVEADEGGVIENCDNVTITPNGDMFVCEDGPAGNGLVRITPDGKAERFAMHRGSDSELAGACSSPDGSVLFVNIQKLGLTLAITGPWSELSRTRPATEG